MCERAHAGLVIAGECERKPAASGRVGASVYTERFNRRKHPEETVTRVTGLGFSRVRLDDQFSANFCVAPFAPAHAPTKGLLPFVGVTHHAPGLEEELFLVPVVVVDVGAV